MCVRCAHTFAEGEYIGSAGEREREREQVDGLESFKYVGGEGEQEAIEKNCELAEICVCRMLCPDGDGRWLWWNV